MKNNIKYIFLLTIMLVLGFGNSIAQETVAVREDFVDIKKADVTVVTDNPEYSWKWVSPYSGIEWYGFSNIVGRDPIDGMVIEGKRINIMEGEYLEAVVPADKMLGVSKLLLGFKKTMDVEINGEVAWTGTHNKLSLSKAIWAENIDAKSPYRIRFKQSPSSDGMVQLRVCHLYGWTPVEISQGATAEDGMTAELELSEALTIPNDTTIYVGHGFDIDVNTKGSEEDVEIEKVDIYNNGTKVKLYFTNITYRHHSVKVVYDKSIGGFISVNDNTMQSYEGLEITNNSPIVPPLLRKPCWTNDGTFVTIRFDKDMQQFNLTDGGGFTINGSLSGSLAIDSLYTVEDNLEQIVLRLSSPAVANDILTVSYAGENIKSADEGVLEALSDFPVVNSMVGADAQLTLDPATDLLGTYVRVYLSKELNVLPVDIVSSFEVKVNNQVRNITNVTFYEDRANELCVFMESPTIKTDEITISYSGDNLSTTEDASVVKFTDQPVVNHSPGVPPLPLVAITDSAATKVIVEFEFTLGLYALDALAKGDFVVEITTMDGTMVKDSLVNFAFPSWEHPIYGTIYERNKVEMEFTKPVLFSDHLHIIYTGTSIQGWDRGVVLPFDMTLHSQMAGADAFAHKAILSDDLSSIFVEFTQDLQVNYVFDDQESENPDAQQVNIDPADFMISINDSENIGNPDILPTKRSFATFVSRYFHDENSLILNLDLDFYQITDWDTVTVQTPLGSVEWMFEDSTRVTPVETYLNDQGSYDWGRTENVTGVWVPQWEELLEARTDSGLVKWSYNGAEMTDTLGRFVPENDTLVAIPFFANGLELLLDTIVVKDTSYVEFSFGDTITGSFQSYMRKGNITWDYGDSTIVNRGKSAPYGTLLTSYDINGVYTAILDTSFVPTDSTSIYWKGGDDLTLTYVPGANRIKTVEQAYDEVLTIPDSTTIVTTAPVYDPVSFIISAPAEFAGSIFKDSVRTVDDAYWVLTMDYKYKSQGFRTGVVQPFAFDMQIPMDAVNKSALAKDFVEPDKEEDELTVYPLTSPVDYSLSINNADGFTNVQVYSLSGMLMIQKTISDSSMDIPVAHMPSGIYIVVLSGSETKERFTGKIVKQ
ncbi:T9SS type A sorting domain-containing protein [Carboxylicivirga marina]|uniref:T9SS type A sorting domain-containing protein n=1 Tax=Carboxylicivirga marina TaxID=2800988 RepID=A0ABS1HIN9_9BACT|nr:T9SS type A sorting domain-containing protein [Carboxylicivirga marina]MBK3517514.1 T9SS type A sorting domain-containing protein [Carboxylicivirga marina]